MRGQIDDRVADTLDLLDAAVSAHPNGRPRHGQQQMAAAVAASLTAGSTLICQAPTGTGKSIAAAIPAIVRAHTKGEPVLIATATTALQDQLVNVDLPHLAAALKPHLRRELSWQVLKGRGQYACRAALDDLAGQAVNAQQTAMAGLGGMTADDQDIVSEVVGWAERDVSGDRADLPIHVPNRLWKDMSKSGKSCPGAKNCAYAEDCFYEQAAERAEQVDIIVVNTTLLCLDLAAEENLLPPYGPVIIDEAHKLVDIASSAFGQEVGSTDLSAARTAVSKLMAGARDNDDMKKLKAAADQLDDALVPFVGEATDPRVGDVQAALAAADVALAGLSAVVGQLPATTEAASIRKKSAKRTIDAVADAVRSAVNPDEGDVCWVERIGSDGPPILKIAPLDVGPTLRTFLFDRHPTILCSATLQVGGSFTSFAGEIGLRGDRSPVDVTNPEASAAEIAIAIGNAVGDRQADDPRPEVCLEVASPFEFDRQGLMYCAATMPRPPKPGGTSREAFCDALAADAVPVIKAAGGATLMLCTSYRHAEMLAERFDAALDVPVLFAGRDTNKRQLIDRFRREPDTVLVGTMGLWEGLDVPGDSLRVLMIDRIPFARPDDPLPAARRQAIGRAGGNPFLSYDVPHSARLLAQGVGRLIRSVADDGVVCLYDSRLVDRNATGWSVPLVNTLPAFPRTRNVQDVIDFLTRPRQPVAA